MCVRMYLSARLVTGRRACVTERRLSTQRESKASQATCSPWDEKKRVCVFMMGTGLRLVTGVVRTRPGRAPSPGRVRVSVPPRAAWRGCPGNTQREARVCSPSSRCPRSPEPHAICTPSTCGSQSNPSREAAVPGACSFTSRWMAIPKDLQDTVRHGPSTSGGHGERASNHIAGGKVSSTGAMGRRRYEN